MAYIYRHIRLDKNEVFYVGIGSDNQGHYDRARERVGHSLFWKKIINKSKYYWEIILDDLTWEEACEKEKEFIKLYGRRNLGTGTLCNLTDGGDGVIGLVHSNESKLKMRDSHLGKKLTEEHKRKIGLKSKGKPRTDKEKALLRLANLGKRHTEITKLKISFKKMGTKTTSHQKIMVSLANSKLILNIQTGIYYESIKEASQSSNYTLGTLYSMLAGFRPNNSNLIYA